MARVEPDSAAPLRRADDRDREIEGLRRHLGVTAARAQGVVPLLEDLKRQARRSAAPRLLGRDVGRGIAWDRFDQWDRRWWPQGISSSADATPDGLVGGRRVLVTTWYSREGDGSRLTFLDLQTLRYRHVLLVQAGLDAAGVPRVEPLRIHAGGLVWAGPWLHIAATRGGVVSCRVDDLLRVPDELRSPVADRRGDGAAEWSGHGYRYLLPARLRHRSVAATAEQRFRYSFLSLDRSGPTPGLIAGEYGRAGQHTRLIRLPLDPQTWLPVTDEEGVCRSRVLSERGPDQMQGATWVDGRLHLTVSHGRWAPGSMYVGAPGALVRRRFAVPMGPEDLAWWPAMGRLWSLTEHPGRRWVFAIRPRPQRRRGR